MAHRHRTKTRAARRIAERTKRNAAAVDAGVEAEEDAKTRPRNARHVAVLDELLHRGVISTDQARAGGRFGRDFRMSGSVIGQLIGRYEPNLPKKPKRYAAPPPDTPHAIEAREAFEQACQALGPLSPIALHTCIFDLTPSAWGANGKPNTDAVGLLRYALSVLNVHYARARYPKEEWAASAAQTANRPHRTALAPAAAPA